MRQANEDSLRKLVDSKEALPLSSKNDYGISIIHAVETNTATRVTGQCQKYRSHH